MSPHKSIYFKHFNLHEGDFVGCECCSKVAVDVHAIEADGMGGRPSKSTHNIFNLMALCRECHVRYGDKKQYKEYLKQKHIKTLERAYENHSN